MEKFFKSQKLYEKKEKEHRCITERIKKLRVKQVYPSWINYLVKPLLRLLLPYMAARGFNRYELLGPFGITHSMSIHFFKKGVKKKGIYDVPGAIQSITFVPGQGAELRIKDESKNTGEFSPSSIGAVNGMNHPDIPITEDTTLAEVLKYVR